MTKSTFYDIIAEIIEEDPGSVSGQELLTDLEGWDSMTVVAFLAVMDKHLSLAISPKELVEAKSVADLLELVAEKITG